MQVRIINYGGIVTKIITPDKHGNIGDVVLGFESLQGYLQDDNPYMGCLIGRYANRIAQAKFTLDGKEYLLEANDRGQSLHGGHKGFDRVTWKAEKIIENTALQLTYKSPDGEGGYPGNLVVTVVYSLMEDNSLKIDYRAATDRATAVNLTSHCYFNLSAGIDDNIFNHELQINADRFTPVNEAMIPTGDMLLVNNTAMDFTSFQSIGKSICRTKDGFDHNWILNKKENKLQLAASLQHSSSGRYMEVYTTKPGLQFYTGNSLNGSLLHTKNKDTYGKYAGLCLETQYFPDAPNQSAFPNSIVRPGEIYQHTTVYKFGVKN